MRRLQLITSLMYEALFPLWDHIWSFMLLQVHSLVRILRQHKWLCFYAMRVSLGALRLQLSKESYADLYSALILLPGIDT